MLKLYNIENMAKVWKKKNERERERNKEWEREREINNNSTILCGQVWRNSFLPVE